MCVCVVICATCASLLDGRPVRGRAFLYFKILAVRVRERASPSLVVGFWKGHDGWSVLFFFFFFWPPRRKRRLTLGDFLVAGARRRSAAGRVAV